MNYSKIKYLQDKNKLSDREFSSHIGLSNTGYAKMMENKTCRVETLELIAKYFNKSISYFFDDQELIKHEGNNSLYLAEDNKDVQITPREFNSVLAAKEETIFSQKLTIKALKEILGNKFLNDDDPPHDNNNPKKPVKGFRGMKPQEFGYMIERMVSDMKKH